MRKFIIEREIPDVGRMNGEEMRAAATKSNSVLTELGPGIQWNQSYVADDRLFCVYVAESEELVREHARRSGFPAHRIIEVERTIDPTTGG